MHAATAARRPPSYRRAWLAAPLLAGVLLLGSCGPKPNTFAPYCPTPRRLSDASQVTIYRAGAPGGAAGQDITDMILQGEIVDVSGVCRDGDTDDNRKTVQADVSLTFRFIRGPAMAGRTYDVPYLVTVSLGNTIRDQAAYRLQVTFPSNVDTVTLVSNPVHMVFPITKTTTAASYTIWAAFRLTPEQLQYNRQHGQ